MLIVALDDLITYIKVIIYKTTKYLDQHSGTVKRLDIVVPHLEFERFFS